MRTFTKAILGAVGVAVGEVVRRGLSGGPRYEPWERGPYREFPKKILIVGGGFAGYTAAMSG